MGVHRIDSSVNEDNFGVKVKIGGVHTLHIEFVLHGTDISINYETILR